MKAPAGDAAPPVVAARRVTRLGDDRSDFAYAVLAEPVATADGGERHAGDRRAAARRRTRLRSGKVVGTDGRFLTECLIANRSTQGGLLRLPAMLGLPSSILVYEDQSGELSAATVMWRRGRDLGIRFAPGALAARHQAISDSMRRKFYAVRG